MNQKLKNSPKKGNVKITNPKDLKLSKEIYDKLIKLGYKPIKLKLDIT
jgi:hypothetical protein